MLYFLHSCSDDVIAPISMGAKLAQRFSPVARFIPMAGGHMLVREADREVWCRKGSLQDTTESPNVGRVVHFETNEAC